jgi:hypothetical protein
MSFYGLNIKNEKIFHEFRSSDTIGLHKSKPTELSSKTLAKELMCNAYTSLLGY